MKKLFALLTCLVLLPLSACADQFEEGEHYETLSLPLSEKPVIQEYFSFYCGHCFNLEPLMDELREHFAGKADVESIHVSFLPNNNRALGAIATRAFVTAQLLGKEREVVAMVFDYNFKKHAMIDSKRDFRNVFIVNGVTGDEFDKAWNSFSVNSKVAQSSQMTRKSKIGHTPTVIVNGKYKVKTGWLTKSTDYMGDYKALIAYLLTLK